MTSERGTAAYGPRWRALLEARWQVRLRELTELSLAYHVAIAAASAQPEAQALLRRTVSAHPDANPSLHSISIGPASAARAASFKRLYRTRAEQPAQLRTFEKTRV